MADHPIETGGAALLSFWHPLLADDQVHPVRNVRDSKERVDAGWPGVLFQKLR
ncbi:MAG TPA: hypothetical protein VNS63_01675 [Blastocatellia bacterium]|nr:hypothetical protein [Blastocatellia bacterium]